MAGMDDTSNVALLLLPSPIMATVVFMLCPACKVYSETCVMGGFGLRMSISVS